METGDQVLHSMMEDHNLDSLIKTPTCFKTDKGKCIDLILNNNKRGFLESKTFETGFSDFHHLVYTVLKTASVKLPPKGITYGCYKKFNEEIFCKELVNNLKEHPPKDHDDFENIFVSTLNKHAPMKTVVVRGNNKPHMNKNLRKAIMKRTRLKNIANETKDQNDLDRYKKQRNRVVQINKRAKRDFFRELDPTKVGNDKVFWTTFKPLLSSNGTKNVSKITLVENGTVLTNDKDISECFNDYFVNITDTLDIEKPTQTNEADSKNSVAQAIEKHKNHPSVLRIENALLGNETFSLSPFTAADVWDEINHLDSSKTVSGKIPVKILKMTSALCFNEVAEIANAMLESGLFPNKLKKADVSPIFKNVGEDTVKKVFDQ